MSPNSMSSDVLSAALRVRTARSFEKIVEDS